MPDRPHALITIATTIGFVTHLACCADDPEWELLAMLTKCKQAGLVVVWSEVRRA